MNPVDFINQSLGFASTLSPFATGPQASGTDLAQSDYNFNYTVFPSDLGSSDSGHYMVININVPTSKIKTNGLTIGQGAGAFTGYFTELNQVSKVDTLRYGSSVVGGENRTVSIPRNTKRIAESIALHMPTPLIFNGQNIYEEVSLTALAGKLGVGTIGTFAGPAAGFLGSVASGAGQIIGAVSQLSGNPINPMVEILFANTPQRQFTFELLMAPRNEVESMSIKKIIQTLRFHGAPEVNSSTWGATWIPPADFDITFFRQGVENTNILRINTCVLERCEVDYAPSGMYSAFRNGYPVAVRLGLGFRELEPIHKQRVLQGF